MFKRNVAILQTNWGEKSNFQGNFDKKQNKLFTLKLNLKYVCLIFFSKFVWNLGPKNVEKSISVTIIHSYYMYSAF